jgi:hypothetical protein
VFWHSTDLGYGSLRAQAHSEYRLVILVELYGGASLIIIIDYFQGMMFVGGFAATAASSSSCFVYMCENLTEKQA